MPTLSHRLRGLAARLVDHREPWFTMIRPVYYHQGCPVCGRTLQIAVELLGRRVYCQHCGGGFLALDEAMQSADPRADGIPGKVDELLERAAEALERASVGEDG